MTFGFIMLRCVRTKAHDKLWQECYHCIRKFYNEEILIIDDNSVNSLLSSITLVNVTVVNSEFPKAGEILGYYYFHKLHPFDKALILHDSMFITRKIDFNSVTDVKFLWHFDSKIGYANNHDYESITQLQHSEKLIELYRSKSLWRGCFGVSSVITWQVLDYLETKYNLFALLPYINKRCIRMSIERVFALICFAEKKVQCANCSFFGDSVIKQYGRYKFADYSKGKLKTPIVKVWAAR